MHAAQDSSLMDPPAAAGPDDPADGGSDNASLAAARKRSLAIEQELREDPSRFRVLTGDRPTGRLHVGHLFGSLENRVRLQDAGVETFVIIADYQVITDRDAVGPVGERVLSLVTDYLAVGLDPRRCTIFTHSAVPALNQLMLPFLALVTDAELRRNPTVKAELAATNGRPMSGLMLTYPVHQAADILFCKANLVPVGKDQLPHVEQTRVVARRFDEIYGRADKRHAVFPRPDALLSEAVSILGVDGQKMSKSRGNAIELAMSADVTAKLIRRAVTDSERTITWEPQRRPEVANLLLLAALSSGRSPEAIADELAGAGAAGLKAVVTEAVNERLAPIRSWRAELAADEGYLRSILAEGNRRANEVGDATLAEVRDAMGMVY
ncbi:tryptophan--tRNA ligase [Micromonospora sp. NBC_01392]